MISTHPAEHPLQKLLTDLARFERVLRPPLTYAEALLALVVAAASSCSALEPQGGGRPLTVVTDVVDVSGSGDIKARCAEVAARVRPVVEDSRTRHLDLLVLATGGASGEPGVLVPWTTYEPTAGLYEAPEHSARHRAEWIAGVDRTCAARLHRSSVSPVYEAVRRALEAIEARCADRAKERFRCARKMLAVQSDLRSTHGEFGTYLCGLARCRTKKAVPPALHLEVGDVELSFCGFSNTDAGDRLPAEAVRSAWAEVLGRPLIVDPTCAAELSPDGAKP